MTKTVELPDRVIERHCACEYVPAANDSIAEVAKIDGVAYLRSDGMVMVRDSSVCPLHSDDPKYDLPEGI